MITCTLEKGYQASLRHVVVHALVLKDRKVLLVKRAPDILNGNLWGLPGGFLSRDETAEEGTLRELKEETRWEGEIISLFSIITQPDRPKEDRQNVAFTFLVSPVKQTGKADTESTEIAWISLDDLPPPEQFAFDHREIIETYKSSPKKLPVLS